MELEVKTRLDNMDLREVRIVPQGTGYTVEIVSCHFFMIYELVPENVVGLVVEIL